MNLFKDRYDLIIAGAGPGGSVTAKIAAEGGLSVLLLEKDRDIGIPVRCAEGVSMKTISQFIEPSDKFIDNPINKIRFIAPDGTVLPINFDTEDGLILNRKVFDFELAKLAAAHGAQVVTRCYVKSLARINGLTVVKFEHYGEEFKAAAPLIVGADGVETMVGRWAGLKTQMSLMDIESCFQYSIYHPDIDKEYLSFYFGTDLAPGGYLWIFPKGEKYANVGLGLNTTREKKGKSAKEYLDEFVREKLPGASILSSAAGSVPSAKIPKKIVGEGVMLVGDAAHQSNPVSGGGIATAMFAGRYAAETALKAVKRNDFSEKTLNTYTKLWNKRLGKEHALIYRLKSAFIRLNDDTLNRAAAKLNKVPYEDRSIFKVFQTALTNEPGLMLDIAKAFLR